MSFCAFLRRAFAFLFPPPASRVPPFAKRGRWTIDPLRRGVGGAGPEPTAGKARLAHGLKRSAGEYWLACSGLSCRHGEFGIRMIFVEEGAAGGLIFFPFAR